MADETTANTSTSQGGSQSAAPQGAASGGASSHTEAATTSNAPSRPAEFADKSFDAYFDPAKGVNYSALAKDINDFRADKAARDLKTAGVPAKPDDYKLALPQTFEMPKGEDGKPIPFQFDESDPRLAPVRAFAHKAGLDQSGFSELLAIHAQYELGEMQQISAARKAEVDKLGANGPARIDAATRFLTSKLGDKRGQALMERMVLAEDIEALEDLVKQFSSQGGGSYSQSHRERPDAQLSEDAYQKMTPVERLLHARKAEQSGRANGHAR